MSNLAVNINSSAQATLTRIKNALNKNEVIIPINANFYFTKGQPGKTSGYIFHEKSLEKEVTHWLKTRTSFNAIMSRYKKYPRRSFKLTHLLLKKMTHPILYR